MCILTVVKEGYFINAVWFFAIYILWCVLVNLKHIYFNENI